MSLDLKTPDDVLELPEGTLMDCVETKKFNDMQRVCSGARVGCVGAAFLVLGAAFALPAVFPGVTVSAWIAMALEASAFGILRVSRWITHHVL